MAGDLIRCDRLAGNPVVRSMRRSCFVSTHSCVLVAQGNALVRGPVRPIKKEGREDGHWLVVQVGRVVVHCMRPEARTFFRLEALWAPAGSPLCDVADPLDSLGLSS